MEHHLIQAVCILQKNKHDMFLNRLKTLHKKIKKPNLRAKLHPVPSCKDGWPQRIHLGDPDCHSRSTGLSDSRSPAATLGTPRTRTGQSPTATCPPRQHPVLFKYSQAGQPKSERASRETIGDLQISKPPAAIRATVRSAAAAARSSLLNLPSLGELSAPSSGFF